MDTPNTNSTFIVGNKQYKVALPKFLDTTDEETWKKIYKKVQNEKYAVGKRKYNKKIVGTETETPKIYVVPRRRGKSYKHFKDENDTPLSDHAYWCEASKGFRFGDLSSYTAGPIVGHGINVLSATWSKRVYALHLLGGKFDINKKDFWDKRKPKRKIVDDKIVVDDQEYPINEWLTDNKDEWYSEWKKWSQAVALCGEPSFKWMSNYKNVCWIINNKIRFDFKVCWYETYVKWLHQFWETLDTFKYVKKVFDKRNIVLVHPMVGDYSKGPTTIEDIKARVKNNRIIEAPWVLTSKLLGISYDQLLEWSRE